MIIKRNEPLAPHTTFRIGGPAALFAEPESLEEVGELLGRAAAEGRPFLVLGGGSNILFPDAGFAGLVVFTGRLNRLALAADGCVAAESGVSVSQLLGFAVKYALAGFEFMAGIPGSIGGVLVMNAGAAGGEISQVVSTVRVLDRDLRERELTCGQARFGYRSSGLSGYPFIAAAVLKPAAPAAGDEIKRRISGFIFRRKQALPRGCGSAGSIFKNPEGDAAGRLIEAAGCKGWRQGGAVVSEKHANFILNLGGATAADVRALMERVRSAVQEKSGVRLEPEIKIIE